MDIHLTSFPEGAAKARGTVIVIDAFRAFTTTAFAFASGAREIIMVDDLQAALDLKREGRADFTIGERQGLKIEGFDFGNSPTVMAKTDLTGMRLVQTTGNGIRTLAAADGADALFASAFVNARATTVAALKNGPDQLTIVAAGVGGVNMADEDELCALYIRSIASNASNDGKSLKQLLSDRFETEEFLSSREKLGPRTDWILAIDLDRFDFAIRITREEGLLVAHTEWSDKKAAG